MTRPTRKQPERAFTLIELLVVVAIIAILAAIAVPNFLEAQTRSKVSRVVADMRTLDTAINAYMVDFNRYPPDFGTNELQSWIAVTTPIAYITSVPRDAFLTENDSHANQGERNVFAYLNPRDVPGWEAALGFGLYYGMVSPGPSNYLNWEDATPTYHWSHLVQPARYGNPAMLYDPTNGTVSDGDIIRTNFGQQ